VPHFCSLFKKITAGLQQVCIYKIRGVSFMHLIQDNKYALKFLFVMMTAEEFIHNAGVESVIDELKEYFADPAHPLNVSDVRDEHNYQYVDLVQEGGGVWGIALVGYTYILEKMGIRFFSLAGTSAGSINAIMLACAGNKEEEKSEKIIQYFLELNLFDIVDGKKSNWRFTKILKRLLHRFISTKDFKTRLSNLAYWFLLLFVSLSLVAFISDFLMGTYVTRWLGLTAEYFLSQYFLQVFISTTGLKILPNMVMVLMKAFSFITG